MKRLTGKLTINNCVTMKYSHLLATITTYIALLGLSFSILNQNLKTKAGNPGQSLTFSMPAVFSMLSTPALETKNYSALKVTFGRYTCKATTYGNGIYQNISRGSFTLTKDGNYIYEGCEEPSTGTFTTDKKNNIHFKGGYFDGGIAEKMDRLNNYLLVFPSNPDDRWFCKMTVNN